MGLTNRMNIVVIDLHLWLQSVLISFHSLTCFAGLINKLLHSRERGSIVIHKIAPPLLHLSVMMLRRAVATSTQADISDFH